MSELQEKVEAVIDMALPIHEKINSVSLYIAREIEQQIITETDALAEDIVFGRISFPSAVEFTCRLD